MGMVGFYARLFPGYSDVVVALHNLTKNGVPFVWRESQQKAFEMLKRALCEAPVLQVPDFSKDIVLATDASDVAVPRYFNKGLKDPSRPLLIIVGFWLPPEGPTVLTRKNAWVHYSVVKIAAHIWSIQDLSCSATTWPYTGC